MTDNPYAESAPQAPQYVGSTNLRPGGITIIGILTLILAGLGILTAGIGLGSQAMFGGIQKQIIAEAEKNPENKELQLQAKIQKKAMDVAEKYKMPNMVVYGFSLVLCLALFVGAIMLLSSSATGRTLLVSLFLVVLACDAGKAVLGYVAQKATMASMTDGMSDMMAGENVPAETEQVAQSVTKIAVIASLIFMVGWMLVKAFFYFWAWNYLRKPEVVSWFEQTKSGGTSPA